MQNLIDKLGWGDKGANMALWVGLSVVLLLLVVAIAVWLIRMLRPSLNMGSGSARGGRPQRLAVTDAFSLDRDGRRLVIIRRDNVEHLLLIGGPNDVVVESNISRNERVIRDRPAGRGVDADAVQIAESALMGEVAPRAEPNPAQTPPPAPIAAPAAPATSPLNLPPLRPLSPAPNAAPSRNPVKPIPLQPAPPPAASPVAVTPPPPAPMAPPAGGQKLDEDFERALTAMQTAQRQKLEAQMPAPAAPVATPPAPQPPPAIAATPATEQPAPQAAPAPQRPARQEPMSEMARRLNEVLQKPLSGQLRPPFNRPIPPVPPVSSKPETPVETPAVPPALPPLPDLPELPKANQSPPPPATTTAPAARAAETEMDMLEEEMARLLGRPAVPQKSEKT